MKIAEPMSRSLPENTPLTLILRLIARVGEPRKQRLSKFDRRSSIRTRSRVSAWMMPLWQLLEPLNELIGVDGVVPTVGQCCLIQPDSLAYRQYIDRR